jgi:hypothetical protein
MLYEKMPMAQYQSDSMCDSPSVSSGLIKIVLNQSPSHAMLAHPKLNPNCIDRESGVFDRGAAAHALFLEGENGMVIIEADDWRTKLAKDQRDEARRQGRYPMLAHQAEDVYRMVEVAQQKWKGNPQLGRAQNQGNAESVVTFTDEGVLCRMRPDWLAHDYSLIVDYKSTGVSANPHTLTRLFENQQFGIQARFYQRGIEVETGKRPRFVFMIQENFAPYAVTFASLAPAYEALADDKLKVGLSLWKTCLESNHWPTYESTLIHFVEPPTWAITQWMEKSDFELENDSKYLGA